MYLWTLDPKSRKCSHTGKPFQAGMTLVSLLFLDPEGQITRADVIEDAVEAFKGNIGEVVAIWKQTVADKNNPDAAVQKTKRELAETVFRKSISDNDEPLSDEHAMLQFLLALYLERHKALKRDQETSESIIYKISKTDETFTIRKSSLHNDALINSVKQQLPEIFG